MLNVAMCAAELGHHVRVLASTADRGCIELLARAGVEFGAVCPSTVDSQPRAFIGKLMHWAAFRKEAARELRRSDDLIWCGSADTALVLGRELLSRQYVLQLRELYDTIPYYQRRLRVYARHARRVVVPEASRAAILQAWYGLDRQPAVLPNKQALHPRIRHLGVDDHAARDALAAVAEGERIVLYQGHIGVGRNVAPVADAVVRLGPGWRLVVMGTVHGGALDEIRAKCPEVLWIPHVSAPRHLRVTSHATVGILHYTPDSLNNVFCAPNKLWEYTGFDIPIVCNALPPLVNTVQTHGAGICLTQWEPGPIRDALLHIVAEYEAYQAGARRLFDSVDVLQIISKILVEAGSE